MAGTLKHQAASSVNKGQPSSFYANEKINPVLQALDHDIRLFQTYIKKKNSGSYKPSKDEASSRASDTLFDLWNQYEPKLPKSLYQSKLLEVGDFLTASGEYNLALYQCFMRYLKFFGDVNVDEIKDIKTFKQVFFAEGFDGEAAGFTFRALMGKTICTYEMVKRADPKLQNLQAFDKCIELLSFLRLITQIILPKERLCWLVYNGTIHIYSISRHLMSLGHSAKVLEFLLWACMCMEASVPLLAVKYLGWRATLYTAVCQCYYDCKSGQHAEEFARRALSKINELSQLEAVSNHKESEDVERTFRYATVKMAVMVYKRCVFERRKAPKGLLRPKTRANLKDAATFPWPRTQTEKLMVDMFEGSATQMLAIQEAMSDSNRRTLISMPPAQDHEVEVLDVFAEMFMAAQEIISGGGGAPAVITGKDHKGKLIAAEVTHPKFEDFKTPRMGGVLKNRTLIDLASKGEDGVPLSTVVKMAKHAYNYEQWDTFDNMIEPALAAVREANDPKYAADEKALELLMAYDRVVPRSKHRKLFQNTDDDDDDVTQPPPTAAAAREAAKKEPIEPVRAISNLEDHLMSLTDVLLSVVNGPFIQSAVDMDMMVDATLMLWKKCKEVFSKYQTGSTDNPKYLQRMDNPSKWMYILEGVHKVVGWCGISAVDPALAAEVVLRLALVFEASAALEEKKKTARSQQDTLSRIREFEDEQSVPSTVRVETASPNKRQGSNLSMSTAVSRETSQAGTTSGDGKAQSIAASPVKSLQEPTASRNLRASKMSMASAGAAGGPLFGQTVREQLLQAREILDTGLRNVSFARQVVALTDQKSIADVSWVKELNREMFEPLSVEAMEALTANPPPAPGEGTAEAESVWNTVRDLHTELMYMYHRVCLKLVALGPDPKAESKRFSRSASEMTQNQDKLGAYIDSFDELVKYCRRNNVSKALLYMQHALTNNSGGTPSALQLQRLQTAMSLIKKAQDEERNMYVINTQCKYTDQNPCIAKVPPAPLLLCRTDEYMTFKPAPFVPQSGEKVAWYRIFARSAAGSNVKVRLNDYFLPGTGEEVPSFNCELKVAGLTPGDKYMFAVAAYTADGKLIGDMVGESTKPILASHPMPLLITWAYLCQVSYQVGCYEVAKEASVTLWQHFVAEPPPPQQVSYVTSAQTDFKLILHRLNQRVVSQASPVLLRMFLASIFIHVDIEVKGRQLFCDKLSDKGPLYQGQIERLLQCERVLVIMQLAGWLNEPNLALQAVVQCYGLLAPLIHYKIPSTPVIQVLERCCVVLQEIPAHLRHKRSHSIVESLHHMTACLTYHMAKVLRMWGQRALASNINQAARDMLALDPDRERNCALDDNTSADTTETGSITLSQLKKKKAGKRVMSMPSGGKDEGTAGGNEELKALEAHMLRLSKQAQGEHELTGGEDPSILHAYIAYLPSRIAYKEVAKFKRRARYLEFLVQCAEKALTEGIAPTALEWCQETEQWLFKRNENLMGTRASIGKQPGAFTIIGDDPKKYQAAMVEYTKERTEGIIDIAKLVAGERVEIKQESPTTSASSSSSDPSYTDSDDEHALSKKDKAKLGGKPNVAKPRKVKYKPIGLTPLMSDTQKTQQEDLELKALDLLAIYFVDTYTSKMKRRKMRRIAADELPWRSQLNTIMGLAQFGVFINRLEINERLLGGSTNYMYRSSFLDQEWFTFETANTLVVGWQGGPERVTTRDGPRPTVSQIKEQHRSTGIEIAAAAATGKPPPPLFPMPRDLEDDDTPRTYRSDNDVPTGRKEKGKKKGKNTSQEEELTLMSIDEGIDLLNRTFTYLRRAVVLAHRGHHWTLLQNACRTMWNTAHAALTRAISPDKNGAPFMPVEMVRKMVWYPFFTAADCLLDMMKQMQMEQDKLSKKKHHHDKEDLPVRSWMGDITDEKGGAGLKFESPLDDVSSTDVRWMKRMIMRVLEILYYEQRWERLVDVALRFNALTDDRYSEFVNPLLVQAQRKLVTRIQDAGGRPNPQPHIQEAERELGHEITSKDYVRLQLKVQFDDDDTHSEIDPGARLDPEGHNAYSGVKSLKLCSVPLDVPQSLSVLRESLSKSQYTSRALQHSRQMLVLYLAGQNQLDDFPNAQPHHHRGGSSKVEFVPNTARPHPSVPEDISREEFLSMDDVQTSPLPKGQVSVVMTSYDKTIEMLLAQGQKGLAAEAMRELANLHYHTGNIRGAYKWWSEALDTLLGKVDTIHTWRSLFSADVDISTALLEKCGLWGCIIGGALCSNIAQYILTSNLGLRTDCCFLAAYFFKALFRSSLPHPVSDRDYALYEVGEGCEVTNLVPGIDLLSERFRSDGRTLVAALRFVMEELARGRHNLFVLPLLTLYQFLTTFTCRDLQRSVDGRILKVRILTDLGLFREALITLQRLLYGDRLPHMEDSSFRHVEGKVPNYKFDTSKPILEPNNLKLLESIVDKRLSTSLGALYGPHLTCHLSLAQAHVFIKLANTIPVLPVFQDMKPPGSAVVVQPQSQVHIAGNKAGAPRRMQVPVKDPPRPLVDIKKRDSKADDANAGDSMEAEGDSALTQAMRRFSGPDSKQPSLEVVKGTLLHTADTILSTLSELVIENAQYDKGLEKMNPSEMELVVQCKLELAEIAQQRHHSSMAARIVLAAMRMLQNAELFKEKRAQMQAEGKRLSQMRRSHRHHSPVKFADPAAAPGAPSSDQAASQYQYQNFQSRSRLDARLWLSCRLALVQSLMGEITGLGLVKGSELKVKKELQEVRQYMAEGVGEAEACGDIEMQTEFMIEAVNLNMMEGKPVNETKELLKDAMELMGGVQNLSTPGQLLRAVAWIQMADLEAAAPTSDGVMLLESSKHKYLKAHGWLLNQLEMLGEKIEHRYDGRSEYSTPISPLENLYLPHVLPLVECKLRVGHAMARLACSLQRDTILSDAASEWAKPLGVLNTALELSKVIACRTACVEAEIYLNMGKVQRQLFQLGQCHQRAAASSLIEAVKTSHSNDHDLGLMRQAYLELAILYLLSSGENLPPLADGGTLESLTTPGGAGGAGAESSQDESARPDDDVTSVASGGGEKLSGGAGGRDSRTSKKGKKWKSKKERAEAKEKKLNPPGWEQERRAAWIAIRCATMTGTAQRARILLVGDPTVTTQAISTKSVEGMPDYIALDLVASYVLGEKKKLYKNEIEEELANLTEELEPPPVETYDDELKKVKEAASQISWTHVMGYQAILQRLCSTGTMTTSREAERRDAEKEGDLGPEFDLGFISHAQFDLAINNDVVRSTQGSGMWALRVNYVHQFLSRELKNYSEECCGVYPPKQLQLSVPKDAKIAEVPLITKSYKANATIPLDIMPTAEPVPPPTAPGTQENLLKASAAAKYIVNPGENELSVQWYQPALDEFTATLRSSDTLTEQTGMDKRVLLLFAVARKKQLTADIPQSAMMWVSYSQLLDLHDRLTVLTSRGEISLPQGTDRSRHVEPKPKKRTTRIKALSPKFKKDEPLEGLLRQCMDDVILLLRYTPPSEEEIPEEESPPKPLTRKEKREREEAKEEDPDAIPFDVTRTSMYNLEKLFDPGFGHALKDPKVLKWTLPFFEQQF